jgi:YVTN family beta-propeller protein
VPRHTNLTKAEGLPIYFKVDPLLTQHYRAIFTENTMKSSFSSTLRVIAVALIGVASLAVMVGCGVAPAGPVPTAENGATYSPLGVAFNPTTNLYYVANGATKSVSVYDGSSNSLKGTIATGTDPMAVAINATTNTIYVTNYSDGTLTVINGATNAVTATVSNIGDSPYAIAVDPITNRVYVADWLSQPTNNLYVLDGTKNSVITGLQVGGGEYVGGLAVNTVTNTIYASTFGGLFVVNGSTNTVTTSLGDGITGTEESPYAAHGVAVDETTNTVYASFAQYGPSEIAVVNGATNAVIGTIPMSSEPSSIAVDTLTHVVYVVLPDTATISVINGSTMAVSGSLTISGNPTSLALNPTARLVYVQAYQPTAALTAVSAVQM